MADWTDRIVGDRMTVDREFNERVVASEFESSEWSLIMTATEFEIENANDPDAARIVANTDKLEGMMPHIEEAGKRQQSMAGAGGSDGGGIIGTVKDALGLGNGREDSTERLAAAERLVQEYADELQKHLEANGKWEQVRRSYDG